MISCARVYWICHFISWISHPRLCFIAFKMKFNYPVPSHFPVSGRDGSGTWKKVQDGSGTGIPSDPAHNPKTIHMETSHVMNMLQLTCLRSRSGRGGGVKSICAPRISWDYRWVPVQTETLLSLVFSAWAELERFVLATDKLRFGGDTSYVWDLLDLRPAKTISTTLCCSVLVACREAQCSTTVGCTLWEARGSSMSRHCLGSLGR